MAPEGEDSAARTTDVAQQQLHNCSRAYVLHSDRMLRPADSIGKSGGALPPRVGAPRLVCLFKQLFWDTARLLVDLGCVTGEVTFDDLKNASWVLQRVIEVLRRYVCPALRLRLSREHRSLLDGRRNL